MRGSEEDLGGHNKNPVPTWSVSSSNSAGLTADSRAPDSQLGLLGRVIDEKPTYVLSLGSLRGSVSGPKQFRERPDEADIASSVLRAVVPGFPFGVERKAPKLGCCTLLYDAAASPQPVPLRTGDDEAVSFADRFKSDGAYLISLPLRDTYRPPQFSPSGRWGVGSGRCSRSRRRVHVIQCPLHGKHTFHLQPETVDCNVDGSEDLFVGTTGAPG